VHQHGSHALITRFCPICRVKHTGKQGICGSIAANNHITAAANEGY